MSTVGVLGDVCRNVELEILPYCDEIMSLLVQNLGREDVHRNIKPNILSSFGDIALVVGDNFEKYLEAVLRVLHQAMQLSVQSAASGGGHREKKYVALMHTYQFLALMISYPPQRMCPDAYMERCPPLLITHLLCAQIAHSSPRSFRRP